MRKLIGHFIFFAILLVGTICRADPSSSHAGEALLKTDIMGIFAHPDDETGASATLALYARGRGKVVANIYCTRGEGGGNAIGNQWGKALGILREAELRDALSIVGVRYCFFLDREDFFYTESASATFAKWNKETTLESLVRYVRTLHPDVIITMNPAPVPGQHGHHQAAAILATEAFDAAADPNRFPDQLKKDGLSVWQVRKLYFTGGGQHATQIDLNQTLPNGRTPGDVAAEAASHHRSQAFGSYAPRRGPARPQSFILAKSVLPFIDGETDLLRGLPIPDDKAHRMMPPHDWQGDSQPMIEFVPRPAIAQYQAWTRAQGIEHVATRMPADVPVVVGQSNEVHLIVHNRDASALHATIALDAPQGWKLDPPSLQCTAQPNSDEPLTVHVTAPPGALADGSLSATLRTAGKTFTASARAHPVPFMEVPTLSAAPSLDGTETAWAGVPAHEIAPTNLVQGRVKDAADSSAHFRVAHDAKFLYFDVDVSDDVVVSNIAPDDIRGHWRSDSIEICLDPAGGAENTLGCFKVGIFPFDTTGHVRAARDADANQGPIEETAPHMRLFSNRTRAGYRIQAAIPFDEIGIAPTSGKIMGFNLIIYDGDKADAAIGENINKSRIAWSPRSGVQGRPEDWGRMELK